MNTKEMRWLLELRKTRNFTKAAENVYTTQSALSQCVSRVEDEISFEIFNRNRRTLCETQYGTHFLNMLEKVLEQYNTCITQIHYADTAILTAINIGVTPYINSLVTDYIPELRDKFPSLKIRLVEGSSDSLQEQFEDGQLQIINTNNEIKDSLIYKFVISSFNMFILLRKGSPVAQSAVDIGEKYLQLDPKFLKEEPLACSAPGSYSRRMSMKIYQHAGFTPEFVQSVTRPTTLCNLALNGTASSIFALSSEIKTALKDSNCLYSIPDSYVEASGKRFILCKKETLKRMPEGFMQAVEALFKEATLGV